MWQNCCKLNKLFSEKSVYKKYSKNIQFWGGLYGTSVCCRPQQTSHFNINLTKNIFSRNISSQRDYGKYSQIKNTGKVSHKLTVPSNISKPDYAINGQPAISLSIPEIKSQKQISSMRDSCKLARQIMNLIGDQLKVGMTTDEIDKIAHQTCIKNKAYPSPLNYKHFPKSVCTSVNNVACHGIPDDRPLQDGDIISVDVTAYYNGFHGDCCETYCIGAVDDLGQHLVSAARRCRDQAISILGPDIPFSAIGKRIQEIGDEENLSIVPVFIGHGIGSYFHGPPDIFHVYNELPGKMKAGMTFTIEPIVSQGTQEIVILEDGWTAITLDSGRAAQFEHTVLITDDGYEILTNYL